MTPARLRLAVVALGCSIATLSCATYQAYDGPKKPGSEIAVISGDAKLRAETPLALVIRAVDGKSVDVRYNSVAVTPGTHLLLVDCQVGGEGVTASRHAVEVTVGAGERYRLTARMRPGNQSCEAVELEAA